MSTASMNGADENVTASSLILSPLNLEQIRENHFCLCSIKPDKVTSYKTKDACR